jgi:sulfur relay (sulfurtransferase) complex TusBCD TusD component (DsrE family)
VAPTASRRPDFRSCATPQSVRRHNGKVWLCGACTKPRGITEEQLAAGMTIVGAAKVVEEIVPGANAGAFA